MFTRKIVLRQLLVKRHIALTCKKYDLEVPSSKPLKADVQSQIAEDKARLQWRVSPSEKKGEWYSKFKLFAPEENTATNIVTALQQPVDLSLKGIKNFFAKKKVKQERFMQQFIPERQQTLGNDLAAAHFIVHRGGTVKFCGQKDWIARDKYHEYSLPATFVASMFIEALKCDDMELYYEGLENIRRLTKLKYLSFKNVKQFDDWCLDRVSGSEFSSLEMLDLSGTNITEKGLQALYRVPTLRKLILDSPQRDSAWKLVIAMLQEIIPNLEIVDSST